MIRRRLPKIQSQTAMVEGQMQKAGRISRRSFMGGVGLIGASALATTSAIEIFGNTASAESQSSLPLHQWAMVFDLRNCDGCKACTMACQQRHSLAAEQTWIKVYTMQSAAGQTYHMARPCMMCENPPCMYVCPVGATFRTNEGIVLVDQSACIGCRTCMAACPYEARYFNWSTPPAAARIPGMKQSPEWPVPQIKDTVGKCVWCADRLPHGELPACVAGCPMGVIYIGDLSNDLAINSAGNVVKLSSFLRDNDAYRFQESYGTNPRVWYIPGHGQDLNNDSASA